MKNIITKTIILKKLALITMLTFMNASVYAESDHNQEKISNLMTTINDGDYCLSEFVNIKCKTPFNNFLQKIKEILHNLQRNIEESTRSHNNELSKEIDDLMDYVLEQFNILYHVLTRYNGKPDSQAFSFAAEIKDKFDTKKIFGIIICKLKVLKNKAHCAQNKPLVDQITVLINNIEKKMTRWNAKTNSDLFAGIAHRMKCQ